jgi:ribosomal protein uL24
MQNRVSSKPRVVRGRFLTAPLHVLGTKMSAHLSEKLSEELNKRALPVRVNDVVKIVRGTSKGKEGKIIEVDRKNQRIFVEKVVRKKSNGSDVPIAIHCSKVIIVELDRSDKKRLTVKESKKGTVKK